MRIRFRGLGMLLALPLLMGQYPEPRGYVSDFADVISAPAEARLEEQLRAYERQTAIEVAVVTVPSLEGRGRDLYARELFNAWGIGKAGADNGLLLLLAVEDREWKVEVGYGLEGELTDGAAAEVGEAELVPRMREGNVDGAIRATVDALVARLGTAPPEERAAARAAWIESEQERQANAEARARQEAEQARIRAEAERVRAQEEAWRQQESRARLMNRLWMGAIGLFLAVALFFAVRQVREHRRRQALRRELRESLVPEQERVIENAGKEAENRLADAASRLPLARDQVDMSRCEEELEAEVLRQQVQTAAARDLVEKDPDAARALLEREVNPARILHFAKLAEARVASYQQALEQAPGLLQSSREARDQVEASWQNLQQRGYRLDFQPLQEAAAALARGEALLGAAQPDPEGALEENERCLELTQAASSEVQGWLDTQQEVAREAPRIRSAVSDLRGRALPETSRVLDDLRTTYEPAVWQQAAEEVAEASGLLTEALTSLEMAEGASTMERQEFARARTQLDRALEDVGTVRKRLSRPAEIQGAQEAAEKRFPELERGLAQQLSETRTRGQHGDAGSENRKRLARLEVEVQSLLAEVRRGEAKNWVRWGEEAESLTQALSTLEGAMNTAIRQAEEEREEARRRAERARQQAAAAAAAAAAARARASSSSSSRSSLGGGGGGGSRGGGFGGGRSGGGGAGGKW